MPQPTAAPHTYDAEVDGFAAQIRCDLALFDRDARPKKSTTLFVLGATLDAPDAAGLPTGTEQVAVDRARTALTGQLAEFNVAIAGDVLSQGTWQTYFYGEPTLEEGLIPSAQLPLRTEGWADWIHAEPDPEWKRYGTFLLPAPGVRIRALSERATQSLSQSGLDLSKPRTLTHTLAFPSKEAAELSLASIIALDFELAGDLKTREDGYTKAKVLRPDPPDHAPAASLMLAELCAPYDGDHVQWIATD